MNKNNENINFNNEGSSSFGFPENYFQKSATNILNKIEWIDEHKAFERLGKFERKNCFSIPINYFSQFESNIELANYPQLQSLKKTNSFKVPTNYFTKTTFKPLNNTSKTLKLFSTKMYYMAAAVLVVTLGIWLYNIYDNSNSVKDCGTLACVDKYELIKATNLENVDNEQLYDLVDPKKLEENLDHKLNYKKDVDSNLKGITDQTILDEI